MSALGYDLRAMGASLASRVAAGVTALRRTTATVALLRLLVAGCLLGGSALSLPPEYLQSRTALVPVGLALVAALAPRTLAVGMAVLAVAAAWLFTTSTSEPPLWRVLAVATLLYVAHASAAFAAVLPHDCAVAPSALRGWASRTALVVVASMGIGAAGMVVTGQAPLAQSLLGPIVGSIVAVGVVGLLAWQLRRIGRGSAPS